MRIWFTSLVLFAVLTLSCNTKQNSITLRESTGRLNELTVIMDNELWQGAVGDSLRKVIAAPVIGLPQEETLFTITQVPPKSFGKLFNTQRNLLFVSLDDAEGFGSKKNLYADPQIAISILGKDKQGLIEQIHAHKDEIISTYKSGDLKLYQRKYTKKHWAIEKIKTFGKLGIEISVPKDYTLVDDSGDFLWFRNIIDKGSMNIIAYEYPYMDTDSVPNAIVAMRDSIGKQHIPGQFDGTYMITEAAFSPFVKKTEMLKKPTFETRGTWEVKGDFMAGPFLNYTLVDKEKNRLLVIEGFTYAPSVNKRDYMFELESIIKTLKI